MNGSERDERLRRIRELLAAGEVRSQAKLAARLRREGFASTQSGLSRDLRELGVAKVAGAYVLPDAAGGRGAGEPAFGLGDLVRAVRPAGPNLLVIHTATGGAARVGLEIDRSGWPEIVGTIAGDDTVFVATPDGKRQARLRRRIAGSMEESAR